MNIISPNERRMRVLPALPAQPAAIDRVLDSTPEPAQPERKGPFRLEEINKIMPPCLKRCEVAGLLQVSVSKVDRMVKHHEINAVRLGRSVRFPRAEVEAILNSRAAGDLANNPTANLSLSR